MDISLKKCLLVKVRGCEWVSLCCTKESHEHRRKQTIRRGKEKVIEQNARSNQQRWTSRWITMSLSRVKKLRKILRCWNSARSWDDSFCLFVMKSNGQQEPLQQLAWIRIANLNNTSATLRICVIIPSRAYLCPLSCLALAHSVLVFSQTKYSHSRMNTNSEI